MKKMQTWAGFVLAGGRSSRMGQDKAALQIDGVALVERMAGVLELVCDRVTLVGDPLRYGRFRWPVIGDEAPGCGPLGGIVSALAHSRSDWNLIAACDMPEITPGFLTSLRSRAMAGDSDCVAPCGPDGGVEPLCAAYRKECEAKLRAALQAGNRKLRDAVRSLRCDLWNVENGTVFRNINTPDDWERFLREHSRGTP